MNTATLTTGPTYPQTVSHRDGLTGYTATVERLTARIAERLGNPNFENRLAVARRVDGGFRCVAAVFPADNAAAAEAAAKACAEASDRQVTYLPSDLTALARAAAVRHPLEDHRGAWTVLHLDGGATVEGHLMRFQGGYVDVRHQVTGDTSTIRMDTITRYDIPS